LIPAQVTPSRKLIVSLWLVQGRPAGSTLRV
jgi:hypothetical protein